MEEQFREVILKSLSEGLTLIFDTLKGHWENSWLSIMSLDILIQIFRMYIFLPPKKNLISGKLVKLFSVALIFDSVHLDLSDFKLPLSSILWFECGPNFFHFHGGCFSIHTHNALPWNYAQIECSRKGGALAKVSREGLRSALSNKLEGMKPKPNNLHIGFLARDDWVWIDGNPLNAFLWMRGYPSRNHGDQSCAVLSAISSRITNEDCKTYKNALCSKCAGMSHSLYVVWDYLAYNSELGSFHVDFSKKILS